MEDASVYPSRRRHTDHLSRTARAVRHVTGSVAKSQSRGSPPADDGVRILVPLMAAWLVVGLIGGLVLPWLGFTPTATPTFPGPGAPTTISLAGIVVTVVLGGLM